MELFRNDSLTILKHERRQAVTEFLEVAKLFLLVNGSRAQYLVDVICGDEPGWDEVLEQPWAKSSNPLTDSAGNLDFLAILLAEGKLTESAFSNASGSSYQSLQKELCKGGLHYLHFRMGLKNQADRMKYTLQLADALFDVSKEDYRLKIEPLHGLSALSSNREAGVENFFDNFYFRRKQKALSKAQILLLLDEKSAINADSFDQAVEILLREGENSIGNVNRKLMALRIENALIPLVYNYGYRLKAGGASHEDICKKVSANIEALLEHAGLSATFNKALKEQILINLISPLPGGVAHLNISSEQLQGVMLSPELIDGPNAHAFNETLCGPIRLFRSRDSVKFENRCTQIIAFYNETGFPFDFDVAVRGRLAKHPEIVGLLSADYETGYSVELENSLTGQAPEILINEHLLMRLMRPSTLKHYSDPAVVKLISLTFNHCKRQAEICANGFRSVGFRKIGEVFKERPHLREDVLDLMHKKDLMIPKLFEFCEFGHRELKMLGSRAPNALKRSLLENAIGL